MAHPSESKINKHFKGAIVGKTLRYETCLIACMQINYVMFYYYRQTAHLMCTRLYTERWRSWREIDNET